MKSLKQSISRVFTLLLLLVASPAAADFLYWLQPAGLPNWGVTRADVATGVPQSLFAFEPCGYNIVYNPFTRRLYWTDQSAGPGLCGVRGADLNGANVAAIPGAVCQEHPSNVAEMWITLDPFAGRMYYSCGFAEQDIFSIRPDGSDKQLIFDGNSADDILSGMRVDPQGGHLYFINAPQLFKADLDGSNLELLATFDVDLDYYVRDLTLDLDAGVAYVAGLENIWRANLDGSGHEVFLPLPYRTLGSITLDRYAEQLYWTDASTTILDNGRINRISTDGTGFEVFVDDTRVTGLRFVRNACSDGLDNDGDGKIDHPQDLSCLNPQGNNEARSCGFGFEFVVLLAPLAWLRRHRRKAR